MPGTAYQKYIGDIKPLPNHILVCDMEQGNKLTTNGIILLDDNGKDSGIRPRWAKVFKVGSI